MDSWTPARVVLAVIALCALSAFSGAKWQHQRDAADMSAAVAASYRQGVERGQQQLQSEISRAFDRGYAEGWDDVEGEVNDAYDRGYRDAKRKFQVLTPSVTPRPYLPQLSDPQVYYDNCTEARANGAAPVFEGDPGYAPHLDRDGDGVGCE